MYWLVALVLVASGCGSRCKDVAHARAALQHAGAPARSADVRVNVPFARANALIAEALREPLTMPLAPPSLPVETELRDLAATVRSLELQPGAPGKLKFAARVEIRDATDEVATLALVGEVAPQISHDELAIGLAPDNLLAISPELGPNARRTLGNAVARWLPARLRDRVPQPLLEAAAGKLGEHLTGTAYAALRRTLLVRLGELTRIRLRLPDVPVARVDIHSTAAALVVDIVTTLPVRRGLAPAAADDDITVRLSGSAVAELANWAIDSGHAPRWYGRTVEPKPDGEFRPRFDYLAEDRAHPFKVYSFQERGGCSFHRVGVRAAIRIDGDRLVATALDRDLEQQSANPAIEAAAWTKYFLVGSLDRSKAIAAHTQLSAGGRTLVTRVTAAAITDDEVRFALALSAPARSPGEL